MANDQDALLEMSVLVVENGIVSDTKADHGLTERPRLAPQANLVEDKLPPAASHFLCAFQGSLSVLREQRHLKQKTINALLFHVLVAKGIALCMIAASLVRPNVWKTKLPRALGPHALLRPNARMSCIQKCKDH